MKPVNLALNQLKKKIYVLLVILKKDIIQKKKKVIWNIRNAIIVEQLMQIIFSLLQKIIMNLAILIVQHVRP